MRFGVIGNGVVGNATAKVWQSVGEVRTWDTDPYKASHSFAKAAECDYVFICVPTPGTDSGPLDCSAVMETAMKLSVLPPKCAVIRSTVNVGTTRKFAEKSGWPTVFWPEFLSMRTAEQDAMEPLCNLVAYQGPESYRFVEVVRQRFPSRRPISAAIEVVEAAKLFSNAYGAAHVSLMNELCEIAEHNDIPWHPLYQCLISTGRINTTYSQVPGPDGKRGFGGHCFPKDTLATAAMIRFAPILTAAMSRNSSDHNDPGMVTGTGRAVPYLGLFTKCPSPT